MDDDLMPRVWPRPPAETLDLFRLLLEADPSRYAEVSAAMAVWVESVEIRLRRIDSDARTYGRDLRSHHCWL